MSAVSVAVICQVMDTNDLLFCLSMATGYTGLVLLAITLLTSPLKVIRKLPNPVSDDFTRDIGIWAAIVSIAHVVFGLQRHFTGRMWLYFLNEGINFPYIRMDLFGTANHTGLIATIILIVLLATSNNRILSALGVKSWKRLQRWNYGLFALVLLHSGLYQVIVDRSSPYPYILAVIGIMVITIQLSGFFVRRSHQKSL